VETTRVNIGRKVTATTQLVYEVPKGQRRVLSAVEWLSGRGYKFCLIEPDGTSQTFDLSHADLDALSGVVSSARLSAGEDEGDDDEGGEEEDEEEGCGCPVPKVEPKGPNVFGFAAARDDFKPPRKTGPPTRLVGAVELVDLLEGDEGED
jgi:hypothetical protein